MVAGKDNTFSVSHEELTEFFEKPNRDFIERLRKRCLIAGDSNADKLKLLAKLDRLESFLNE